MLRAELFQKISPEQLKARIIEDFGGADHPSYETEDQFVFAYLVAVAELCYSLYVQDVTIDEEGVDTNMLAGVPVGAGLTEGLIENLEILYPDTCFRMKDFLDRLR
jgi:hypothetical protein